MVHHKNQIKIKGGKIYCRLSPPPGGFGGDGMLGSDCVVKCQSELTAIPPYASFATTNTSINYIYNSFRKTENTV